MQVSVDAEHRIIQHGEGLGERDGCTIRALDDQQTTIFLQLLAQVEGDGYIALQDDGTIRGLPMSQAWRDAEEARIAADAALKAAVAEHPDPIVKELARRLGLA